MVDREEENGVLLYYKYASVPDVPNLVRFYDTNCKSLGLLGRVRIAPDGVNVTVGGAMSSLEKHIASVKSNDIFEGTDFKLASCHWSSDERVAKECGFTSLSIRVVKELVTFCSHPLSKSPTMSNAGKHLSATEFHSVLQNAGNSLDCNSSKGDKKLILLDARNVYETRIGKFQLPNVVTLNPEIRQYSDLPSWIDSHSEQLRGNSVLMYCTGGIRCEMASAYIRSKGAGYEHVYQLFGGIQRYLEQFPEGGFFKGKNFVFDHRISVGSSDADIIGSCLLCGSSFDDYSSRCRCIFCRMLVLVCINCQGKSDDVYVCELCQRHGKGYTQVSPVEKSNYIPIPAPNQSGTLEPILDHMKCSRGPPSGHGSTPKKLRILCLHGFRQNASSFKGRTASLARKLRNMAEFVFVDAPHELPFIFQPRSTNPNPSSELSSTDQITDFSDASLHYPPEKCKKRFAWLVATKSKNTGETDWSMTSEPFDPLQYQQQTEGLEESYAYLKRVLTEMGPFDGILGFSQGAGMAAFVCSRQRRDGAELHLRFAILCSGFVLSSIDYSDCSINCPSLHIFGNGKGKDRQIAQHESMKLVSLFEDGSSVVIEHESGHIIPAQTPYIDQIKAFLERFDFVG